MFRLIFIFLLLSTSFLIPPNTNAADSKIIIEADPRLYPTLKEKKGVSTLRSQGANNEESIPTSDIRDKIFSQVISLQEYLTKLDELDKDLLLLRAKNNDLVGLSAMYPEIPQKTLEELKIKLVKK